MGNNICSEISNRKNKTKNRTNEINQIKTINYESLENVSGELLETILDLQKQTIILRIQIKK